MTLVSFPYRDMGTIRESHQQDSGNKKGKIKLGKTYSFRSLSGQEEIYFLLFLLKDEVNPVISEQPLFQNRN